MNWGPPPRYRRSNIVPLLLPESQETILARPVPPWPRQFKMVWEPLPGGPEYAIAATTRGVSRTLRHSTIEDIREITLRVLGSKQRRANDWKDYRLCIRGRALPPGAAALWESSENLMVMGGDGAPPIVISVMLVGVRHTATPTVHVRADFTLEAPEPEIISIGRSPTENEAALAYRGLILLTKFTTTMTARGRRKEREDDARCRLLEALLELKQTNRVIDRETISTWAKGVTSPEGVAELLDRAGWAMTARSGKPIVKAIADRVHALRVRIGLSNLSIKDAVVLAERADWDLDQFEKLATTHE